jgi:hypothetical protein
MRPVRFHPVGRVAVAAGLVAVLMLPGGSASASRGGHNPADLRISVLSGRADLVTGGDALVRVDGVRRAGAVRVRLNGADVTTSFARRPNGAYEGLVTGLRLGRNDLRAIAPGGRARGAAITLTNHPLTGPVFAGPQVQPWDCDLHPATTGLGPPRDAECSTPTVYRWLYKSTAGGGLRAYEPAAPPADVATTTTDAGVTVPYVVRVETGVQDRGIYQVAVLRDPARPWSPWAPQAGWNRKVVWPFGGGSNPQHVTSEPQGVLDELALSRGYLVASSGLHVNNANVNHTVAAEALAMLKEHVVETYGPIRYTIGAGCSGGAIMQQVIAEQYPGLLDGILPGCSYPDVWTTATEVLDCGILLRYFGSVTEQAGWTEAQKAAVMGTKDTSVCNYWSFAFLPTSYPDRAQNCGWAADDPRVYDRETNPGGTRCGIPDYQVAIWGRRPRALWTDAEKAAGHGFARVVADNTGVLYGLTALRDGVITPAQFADLNARIGGSDIDSLPQPQRRAADPGTPRTAYRAGQVTQGHRLDRVPMIDLRGSANTLDIHTDFHSWELRARLDEANGHHANQVIWTWPATGNFGGISPPAEIRALALTTMDRWLAGIEADRRHLPLELKVRLHRPADAVDSCWPAGTSSSAGRVVDPGYAGTCGTAFPHYGDARTVAGERLSGATLKCRTVPLRRAALPQLSDAEFAAVRSALSGRVCDWSRPGVGYQRSLPWMSFTSGPGGRPLGPAPTSRPVRR